MGSDEPETQKGLAPAELQIGGALSLPEPRPVRSLDDALDQIEALRSKLRMALSRIGELEAELEQAAALDPVTGLLAEPGLVYAVRIAGEWSRREGEQFGLVVVKVPRLDSILESQGRAAWEDAVREAAAAMVTAMRAVDQTGRIGTSSFVTLGMRMSRDGAYAVMDRVRWRMAEAGWQAQVGVVWTASGAGPPMWEVVEDMLGGAQPTDGQVYAV